MPVEKKIEGLERYDYGYIGPDGFILPNKDGEYVRFDQAEAIIAAKDMRIEELLATDLSKLEECNCLKEQINELEADNAALSHEVKRLLSNEAKLMTENTKLTARVKELEAGVFHDLTLGFTWKQVCEQIDKECVYHKRRAEDLETQLAVAKKLIWKK